MEYEILNLSRDATLKDAKVSLNKIRLENHPDKINNYSESHKRLLYLSEIAYKRLTRTDESIEDDHTNDVVELGSNEFLPSTDTKKKRTRQI